MQGIKAEEDGAKGKKVSPASFGRAPAGGRSTQLTASFTFLGEQAKEDMKNGAGTKRKEVSNGMHCLCSRGGQRQERILK